MPAPFNDSATLALLRRLFALKRTKRTGWLRAGVDAARCESVADHAFYVVLLTALGSTTKRSISNETDASSDEAPPLDRLKALEMAIVHDLAETIVGDLTPDDVTRDEKFDRERAAMIELCRTLPDGGRWLDLWGEYERQDSPEARFVRTVDRAEMAWQSALYAEDEGIDSISFQASALREADPAALSRLNDAFRRNGDCPSS